MPVLSVREVGGHDDPFDGSHRSRLRFEIGVLVRLGGLEVLDSLRVFAEAERGEDERRECFCRDVPYGRGEQ